MRPHAVNGSDASFVRTTVCNAYRNLVRGATKALDLTVRGNAQFVSPSAGRAVVEVRSGGIEPDEIGKFLNSR